MMASPAKTAPSNKQTWFSDHIQDGLFDLASSPMPAEDVAVPAHGPRLPNPFPPDDWSESVTKAARSGKTPGFFDSVEEVQAKKDCALFQKVFAEDDPEEGAIAMRNVLSEQLDSQYKGKFVKRDKQDRQHPDEARIQRACISLEALLASGQDLKSAASRKVVLRAVHALPRQKQIDLLRADEISGRRLYSALYQAAKDDPGLKASFAKVKAAAQRARIGAKFDRHDPSGQTNSVVNGVLQHLDRSKISPEEQDALIDKLNFKMTMQNGLGNDNDVPLPKTGQPGWRQKLAANTLSLLAECPSVSDESIEKALDLPEPDLLKVLGNSYMGPNDLVKTLNPEIGRREGDVRLGRVARKQAAKQNPRLLALLEGLESNYYDRRLMLQLSQDGLPLLEIMEVLEADAAKAAGELSNQAGLKVAARLRDVATRKATLAKELEEARNPNYEEQQRKAEAAIPKGPEEEVRKKKEQIANAIEEDRRDNPNLQKRLALEIGRLETAEAALQRVRPPSQKETQALLKRFGRYSCECLLNKQLQGAATTETILSQTDVFRQVEAQVAAIKNPKLLAEGLNKSNLVLPTAGKKLKSCPWLQSTAEDLIRIATDVREVEPKFTLRNNPIVILDQSADELWQENDVFVLKLEAEYKDFGLTIKHVAMGDINKMIRGSGVEKLFDTTGQGNAGYGGCRNMAFLLGPVVQAAVRDGVDPRDISPKRLPALIKQHALTRPPKVFMGDDTDNVAPGGLASKAALAVSEQHQDKYSLISGGRFGRDTQGVSSATPNNAMGALAKGGLEGFTSSLYGANRWAIKQTTPGMGCTFGEPRFCLDLPTGAEEKHCEPVSTTTDQFGLASHLSGDRQNAPSAFLKSYMAYSNMTETVKALFDVNKLPWNAEAKRRRSNNEQPFTNLAEIMGGAASPEVRKQTQKSVLTNLVAWRQEDGKSGGPLQLDGKHAEIVTQYVQGNQKIDAESRDELEEIAKVYADAKRQAQAMKLFTDGLLAELNLQGAGSPEELAQRVDRALRDPGSVQNAIDKVRRQMTERGTPFDAKSPMLRDLALVLESLAGGGFSGLCEKLMAD